MVRKCALVGGFVLALLTPAAASAAGCTKQWVGGNGEWGVAANWSPPGVPTSTDDVCIEEGGIYTVTMTPSDSGTIDSLTLGAVKPLGSQTLSIVGQSNVSGSPATTVHKTVLTLSSGGSIARTGQLILDATGNGTTNDGVTGGSAELDPGTLLDNGGGIVTQVEDPQWGTTLGAGTITNTNGIADVSGVLTTTASVVNDGGIEVSAGATDTIGASVINDGTFFNGGITTVQQQGSSPIAWAQSGGAETGNPVELREGATLVDSAGGGAFLFDVMGGGIVGTIPAGQTVTVRGEGNDTTVTLGGGTAPVINHGDLVLEAPGSGTSSGGTTHLTGGALFNYGRLIATVSDPSWSNYLQVPLTNEPGGIADVNSGVLHDSAAVANAGTAEMAPGAHWALDSGSSFVNESNGELEPDINGRSSFGTVDLTGGKLTAGGSLAPFLVEGYVPTANAEFRVIALSAGTFTGSFSKVFDGFTADYSHESSAPAFVGAIYHQSSTPPPSKKAVLRVGPVKGGVGVVTVALSCSGSGRCAAATIIVTAKHGRVVARGGATLNARSSKTVTLKVKTKRKENVSVTVSAGGKRFTQNVSVSAKK